MKRQLVALLATSAALFIGCGEGLIGMEVMEGDIRSQTDPMIQRSLEGIEAGTLKTDSIFAARINQVLRQESAEFSWLGVENLALLAYDSVNSATQGSTDTCPYLGPAAQLEGTSCSSLVSQIEMEVQEEIARLRAQAATEGEDKGDGTLGAYRQWFKNAVDSTEGITLSFLADHLRGNQLCDRTSKAAELSAKDKGVAEGRALFIQAIQKQLDYLGVEFTYPGKAGEKVKSSTRYCEESLRTPALKTAEEMVARRMSEGLCSENSLKGISSLEVYAKQEQEFKLGLKEGVEKEFKLAQQTLLNGGVCLGSPLVLDLAGDGIAMAGATQFDLLSKGTKVETSWINGDDALLVRDSDGNGQIDDGNELFGNSAGFENGFAKLAAYDSNHDGRIDARDPVYTALRVWQDKDGNGLSSANELAPLTAKGVKAIELSYTETSRVDSQGNQFRQTGRFVRTDGSAGSIVDVWFAYR